MTKFREDVVGVSPFLKPFAVRLTGDISEAEDLIQETMLRAISNEGKFQFGTNLKAWLFTIMKNIFINNYRKKVKRKTIADVTDNLFYLHASATAINNGERSFVMKDINRVIQDLSPDYRVPFLMHYKGYKYQEIAETLNLPLGTVKSRIFFARKELKDRLHMYGDAFR